MSLFDEIGGEAAVDAAVKIFYNKVLDDTSLRPFFMATDMEEQVAKQKNFLIYAFGGPVHYSGKSLRAAHAPLLKQGLSLEHFKAVAMHLRATLEQLEIEPHVIEQVMDIVGGTQKDVLGQ